MNMDRNIPAWLIRKARRRGLVILALLVFLCILSLYSSHVMFPNHGELPNYSSSIIKPGKPTSPSRKPTNFTLIYPHVEPKLSPDQSGLYIAVVVNSGASGDHHRGLREGIRKTWGNMTTNTANDDSNEWKLFFTLGISDDKKENKKNLQEALKNNDIIIGNFKDLYKNIPIKTFMAHYWVTSRLPACKYVLKTDDDVYVRVPEVVRWLQENGSPRRFYGGYIREEYIIIRHPSSPWFVSEEEFDELAWPPYCLGAFHVLSTDILPDFFHYTLYNRKPFSTDDAYLGVVARDLDVRTVQIPGFNLKYGIIERSDCDLLNSLAIGHLLDVPTMIKYHSFYNSHNSIDAAKCPPP